MFVLLLNNVPLFTKLEDLFEAVMLRRDNRKSSEKIQRFLEYNKKALNRSSMLSYLFYCSGFILK